jgi:hypothetical protein
LLKVEIYHHVFKSAKIIFSIASLQPHNEELSVKGLRSSTHHVGDPSEDNANEDLLSGNGFFAFSEMPIPLLN